ncbi:MAG: hypothetical protein AAGA09_08265 [Pseudomonadota bacterium]
MLAAENWCIKVEDKVYGPYTSQQMRKFAHEGRLAAWSLISPAGSRAWREAKRENTFAQFFGSPTPSNDLKKTTFGKRNEGDDSSSTPSTATAAQKETAVANFIIIFDVVSAAATTAQTAVTGLGPAFRIADNVWSVACELTAVGVRNSIAPYLNASESVFVIDTTRGRTSWQNFSPELHAKINSAYRSRRA